MRVPRLIRPAAQPSTAAHLDALVRRGLQTKVVMSPTLQFLRRGAVLSGATAALAIIACEPSRAASSTARPSAPRSTHLEVPAAASAGSAAGGSSGQPHASPQERASGTASCLAARVAIARLQIVYGEKHPRMVKAQQALAACRPDSITDTVCVDLRAERRDYEQRGYGPKHPQMKSVNAGLTVCDDVAAGRE